MAGGIDKAYPQANWDLFHVMVSAGRALISELAPGTAPSRIRFLQRNRLIAEGIAKPYAALSFPIELTMNQKRIQDAMRAGSRFPDEIAAESGLSLATVLNELRPT